MERKKQAPLASVVKYDPSGITGYHLIKRLVRAGQPYQFNSIAIQELVNSLKGHRGVFIGKANESVPTLGPAFRNQRCERPSSKEQSRAMNEEMGVAHASSGELELDKKIILAAIVPAMSTKLSIAVKGGRQSEASQNPAL